MLRLNSLLPCLRERFRLEIIVWFTQLTALMRGVQLSARFCVLDRSGKEFEESNTIAAACVWFSLVVALSLARVSADYKQHLKLVMRELFFFVGFACEWYRYNSGSQISIVLLSKQNG